MTVSPTPTEPVWLPTDESRARARLTEFLRFVHVDSFEALHARSVEDVAWFTESVLRFLDIEFDPPYSEILDVSSGSAWARWCVGGGLNISRTCLDHHQGTALELQPAVIWEGEEGVSRALMYGELARETERCARGLRAIGIGAGDAVGIHLPMIPEAVVALLALARVGAVAVPLFSGYGPGAIESRLRDVRAKLLITCDAFPRRGRRVEALAMASEALDRLPPTCRAVVVPRMGGPVEFRRDRYLAWEDLLEAGSVDSDASAEATAAEDPLLVLYTSGTTGRPKGILHSHCGFPIKSAQDLAFSMDVGSGTRTFWLTDLGWMMGPWLVYGTTILGATMIIYDGAPDYPEPDRLWRLCEAHGIEVMGLSPTIIRALMVHGDALPARHDLSSVRIFGSTGEPWNLTPWRWLFEKVGRGRVPIINYSGGTEISGGILSGNPLLPLKPTSFAAPCPGMAASVFDEDGQPVRGGVGELVLLKPWIGMARGFLNDPARYLETYWSRWPDVWVHGDWACVEEDGTWHILGRSDDTLKVSGKRVGPAELESILVGHPAVAEAAVIGVPDERKGTALVAFCVSRSDRDVEDLEEQLRARVATELGKALQPSRILLVPLLPKTRNAKVMRRVIRAAYLGEDLGDIAALEDPQAIEAIRQVGDRP